MNDGAQMTGTVAKAVRKMSKSDKASHALVGEYVSRYMQNRGLVATFPRICAGMMAELDGWPVRNADGGSPIAYFSSYDAASTSIVAHVQVNRKAAP